MGKRRSEGMRACAKLSDVHFRTDMWSRTLLRGISQAPAQTHRHTFATAAIVVRMPQLSPAMEAGTVSKWLMGEGDLVENTQLFVEIQTHTLLEERSAEPMTMEIESHDEGYVAKILVSAGTTVPPGTPIALLSEEEDEIEAVVELARGLKQQAPPRERTLLWQAYLKQDTPSEYMSNASHFTSTSNLK